MNEVFSSESFFRRLDWHIAYEEVRFNGKT